MIKAVNMKGYKFGKLASRMYAGFGMLDTETDEFLSFDGFHPYVLDRKKLFSLALMAVGQKPCKE